MLQIFRNGQTREEGCECVRERGKRQVIEMLPHLKRDWCMTRHAYSSSSYKYYLITQSSSGHNAFQMRSISIISQCFLDAQHLYNKSTYPSLTLSFTHSLLHSLTNLLTQSSTSVTLRKSYHQIRSLQSFTLLAFWLCDLF